MCDVLEHGPQAFPPSAGALRCARRGAQRSEIYSGAVRGCVVPIGDVGCRRFADQLLAIGASEEAVGDEVVHIARDCTDVGAVRRVELLDGRLVEGHLIAGDEAERRAGRRPSHVLVGTSTNGERRPPWTLPNSSSTGAPFSTRIGSACGGARPSRTHKSRFCSAALKWIELGNRLRGPSLHSIGGTARPALTMSAGAAE